MKLFGDELHQDFGSWPLAYIPYGGPDFGTIAAVAEAVGDGDDTAFHAAWLAAGDRLAAEARDALVREHRVSARESFLQASVAYCASYHPLYGKPVDPRLIEAFRKQISAFDEGLALFDPPILPVRIPFEGTSLPAYLVPATDRGVEIRPLVILTNGYDATVTDLYFASAVAASRRGYHCLIFDGPGQGEMLYEHGVPLRPDWETVVRAVVDFAVSLPTVDPTRIALSGWSLGGHLALRAATDEPRLAACIADPGLWSVASAARDFANRLGAGLAPEASLATLDADVVDRMFAIIQVDRGLRWKIVQRGFWANGASDLRDYLHRLEDFTLEGRIQNIECPVLLTQAENDPLAGDTQTVFDALRGPKRIMRFTAAEGAGDHCEMQNRSLMNRRVLDWLDSVMAARGA
ncbi:alpha/beta hydrolase family protein [Reyranella sp.]|uniref:alpha/beta hydrolase family protein n=1 Tax=Reyranella sp. TaxID=1929291 RepID=UPI004037232A